MIKRDLESGIKYLLSNFPVVCLLGSRQVGKSTLMKLVAPQAPSYDLESDRDFERINTDPEFFLKDFKDLVVIDEAQLSPALFRALRVKIDQDRKRNGQFLISGSSSFELLNNISESLAGRVAIVEVPTLSWHEVLAKPQSNFYTSLKDPANFKTLVKNYSYDEILNLAVSGLYPEAYLSFNDQYAYDIWQDSYFQTYINRDIRALFPDLKLDIYKRFIKMLCYASGEMLNAAKFAKSLDVSQPTIKKYLEIAEGTMIWRKLIPYSANLGKRLVKTPKGYLRDNAIANYVLKIGSLEQLKNQPNYGQIWENFVIEQLIKNFEVNFIRASYYYYRTHDQAEVDFILDSKQGLIPFEIKVGTYTKVSQLKALKDFVETMKCPYGVVINQADEVREICDNIYQVPACFL
jgi:predicted AAA+ superfamily ATPase